LFDTFLRMLLSACPAPERYRAGLVAVMVAEAYGDVIMQIRYVVSTMIFWGREHPLSFEQECQYLESLGFGIELWPHIKGHHE
jgi:hypothetical protein